MSVSDVSGQFRKAFRDGARIAIDDPKVKVCLGHPGPKQPDRIFMVGDTTSTQDFATLGTNRSRELTITQEGLVSVFVRGTDEAEEVASDQACDLLNRVEEYFRGDGTPAGNDRTRLGGLVRWCFCTSVGPIAGFMGNQPIAGGRTVEIPFTFTAPVRITS